MSDIKLTRYRVDILMDFGFISCVCDLTDDDAKKLDDAGFDNKNTYLNCNKCCPVHNLCSRSHMYNIDTVEQKPLFNYTINENYVNEILEFLNSN